MTVPVELAHHLANISSGLPFLQAEMKMKMKFWNRRTDAV
jgi:hypothetical protein